MLKDGQRLLGPGAVLCGAVIQLAGCGRAFEPPYPASCGPRYGIMVMT